MPITLKQSHGHHSNSQKRRSMETQNILSVLQQIEKQTASMLEQEQIQEIQRALKHKEMMTFEVMYLTENEYFGNQLQKIQSNQIKKEAQDWINNSNELFALNHQSNPDSKGSSIVIKQAYTDMKAEKNKKIQKMLKQSGSNILNLKTNRSMSYSNSLSQSSSFIVRGSSSDKYTHERTEQQIKNLMEFKERSYWEKNTEKTQKIQEFLAKQREEDRERRRKMKKEMQRVQKKKQLEEQQFREKRESEKKQIIKKGLQKSLEYKQKRVNYMEEHENQLQEIEEFLDKIQSQSRHQNKRLHQVLEEKYREQKNRENMKKKQKLERRKQLYRPLEAEDFQEHLQKYLEYKESLTQERKAKQQEFESQKQEAEEELKNMFHSKRYNKIAQSSPKNQNPYRSLMSELKEKRSKQKEFAQSVGEKFKPTVSEKKRHMLEESVRQLILEEDPTKRKIYKNGSAIFEDKVEIDGRKLGKQYLIYLSKYLEGKPKKKRSISTSLADMPPIHKKVDYLRQGKPSNLKFKAQNSEWKKVMDDQSFKAKDKYVFVKQSITTLEHKAIDKEIEARNLKRSSLELEKKEQFDKLYMESIEAKMAILNGLMLGK